MAPTRLRRTFHYPTESDSDDPPDIDEEHQEELLSSLQTQDETTNSLYRHLYIGVPILTSLIHIHELFTKLSWIPGLALFTALLSAIVPALGAYLLYFHPFKISVENGLRSLFATSGRNEVELREQVLIGLGTAGALVLMLQTQLPPWTYHPDGRAWLPAVVWFMTLFMRQQLAPVDMEELQKARYELKGA